MNRLEKGLNEMGLSTTELMKNFVYVGGNYGDGLKRWVRLYGNEQTPEPLDECVCGHHILDNRYLINADGEIVVLGNCCIKRFLPKDFKLIKCRDCGAGHKNRKVEYCNQCRFNHCENCNKDKIGKYLLCSECYFA